MNLISKFVFQSAKQTAERSIGMLEIMLSSLTAHNSVTIELVRKLIRRLRESHTENGLPRIYDLLERDMREYDKHLIHVVNIAKDTKQERFDLQCRMADTLDESDELIKPYIEAIRNVIGERIPSAGQNCPVDRDLMADVMMCEIMLSISLSIYEHAIVQYANDMNFDIGPNTHIYGLRVPHARMLNHMLSRLRFKNQHGQTVRFNYTSARNSPAIMGTRDPATGCNHGSPVCDYRDAIFSTAFLDYYLLLRDGKDMKIRNITPTLFVNFRPSPIFAKLCERKIDGYQIPDNS